MKSLLTIFFLLFVVILIDFGYIPRWNKSGNAGVISYDVAGYYMYLPAIFIYKDIKEIKFQKDLDKKPIRLSPHQAYPHAASGNMVFQYTCGQAIFFMPFFFIGHLYALNSEYLANGFSIPYQFSLVIGSLIYFFLGLLYCRKVLLSYFSDKVTAIVIFLIVAGSNFLVYASINGLLVHNTLFFLTAALLYYIQKFHEKPSVKISIIVGFILGFAALIRPTEILLLFFLFAWNLNVFSISSIKRRISDIIRDKKYFAISIMVAAAIGSIQLIYWKYVTDDWIVYSYREQGFSFLSPYIYECLFSAKAGWLVYSPMMIFSFLGFLFMYRKFKALTISLFVYIMIFAYICFSWDIWWYGGSLGQRAMIQSYPILAIPMGFFINEFFFERKGILKWAAIFLAAMFLYTSIWFGHMAHKGQMIFPPQVTGRYLVKVFGKWNLNREHIKLLDTQYIFEGKMKNIIYPETKLSKNSMTVNAAKRNDRILIPKIQHKREWLRLKADLFLEKMEYIWWKQSQWSVKFYKNEKCVYVDYIRLHRFVGKSGNQEVFFDVKLPSIDYDSLVSELTNSDQHDGEVKLENITYQYFD